MAILSFLGNTFIACRILDEGQYPGAKLYVMEANFPEPTPEGSTNVNDLSKLRGVFLATQGDVEGTAFINSTEWGEWGPVDFVGSMWLECQPIPMPDDKYMEPQEAHKKMVAKGYDGPFLNMIFRKPLYPGVEEPKYIFTMTTGLFVLVGAITGKVETEEPAAGKSMSGSLKSNA